MANITVIPTRMELTRLKKKLVTARRGHKLLKDKRDGLMKSFLETVRDLRSLRAEVEEELRKCYCAFSIASALMGTAAMEQALLCPKERVSLTIKAKNVMGVRVPVPLPQYATEQTKSNPHPTRLWPLPSPISPESLLPGATASRQPAPCG